VSPTASPTLVEPPTGALPEDTPDTRARLLQAGLRLFALQGFARTSTRELAEAAQVNIAAISYHFGDKAGLYRAVFFEPMGGAAAPEDTAFAAPGLPLAAALRGYYAAFLEPLKQGDSARLCMKLHFRELLEPTGLWEEQLAHGIRPMHDAMLAVLQRELGLREVDADLQRLALALAGLAVHLHVGRDVNDQLAPGLLDRAEDIDVWAERLVLYALAMVQAEAARRAQAPAQEDRA
jgi:AcrR family transcriptional regulator